MLRLLPVAATICLLLLFVSQLDADNTPDTGDILINEYVPNSAVEWSNYYTLAPLRHSTFQATSSTIARRYASQHSAQHIYSCIWLLRHGVQQLSQQYRG